MLHFVRRTVGHRASHAPAHTSFFLRVPLLRLFQQLADGLRCSVGSAGLACAELRMTSERLSPQHVERLLGAAPLERLVQAQLLSCHLSHRAQRDLRTAEVTSKSGPLRRSQRALTMWSRRHRTGEKVTGTSVDGAYQWRAKSATSCADGMSKPPTLAEFEWFHCPENRKENGGQQPWLNHKRLGRIRAENHSNGTTLAKVVQAQTLQRWRRRLSCTLGSDALGITRVDGVLHRHTVRSHRLRAAAHVFELARAAHL